MVVQGLSGDFENNLSDFLFGVWEVESDFLSGVEPAFNMFLEEEDASVDDAYALEDAVTVEVSVIEWGERGLIEREVAVSSVESELEFLGQVVRGGIFHASGRDTFDVGHAKEDARAWGHIF